MTDELKVEALDQGLDRLIQILNCRVTATNSKVNSFNSFHELCYNKYLERETEAESKKRAKRSADRFYLYDIENIKYYYKSVCDFFYKEYIEKGFSESDARINAEKITHNLETIEIALLNLMYPTNYLSMLPAPPEQEV